jgi:hypothetical protein
MKDNFMKEIPMFMKIIWLVGTILGLSFTGFIIWLTIKLLQYFTII